MAHDVTIPVCFQTLVDKMDVRWFTGAELNEELGRWLSDATVSHSPARAIIAPYV